MGHGEGVAPRFRGSHNHDEVLAGAPTESTLMPTVPRRISVQWQIVNGEAHRSIYVGSEICWIDLALFGQE